MPRAFVNNLLAFFVLSVFLSCRKDPALWDIQNLSGDKVLVFGHGGMGSRSGLPMNSMESLCQCLGSGADGTEMDVQLSADSVLFFYHDNDLGDATTGSGQISQKPASVIADSRYRKGGKQHQLVVASSFFEGCGNREDMHLTFDCKLGASDQELFARSLMAFIRRYDLSERCFIESTEPSFLEILESADPALQTYFYCKDLQSAIDLRGQVKIDGVTISMELINAEQIKAAHARGLKVSLFGMDTEMKNVDALMMSPDNLQTDKVEHLVEVYVNRR